jgi:hypothetical protein
MRTGRWRDRSIAGGAALAWHVLIGWYLIQVAPLQVAAVEETALQVIYIPVRAPSRPHPVVGAVRSRRAVAAPAVVRHALAVVATASPTLAPLVDGKPLAGTFLDQAHAWAQREAGQNIPPPDPFASRQPHLPGERDGRFRVQRQRSPSDLVAAVGGYLFAPPGYQADPCPRNGTNIGNLMAGQDAKALQQELDFERRHCRP